ncbi:MAG: MmgE/PrpD family protein, partial [Rhodospirillaceae bacterium]|nr:MmgE/PrpD family protein [Rhodospirillaceae bacterium]
MASISRQFAEWVVGLEYEDLPPAVVDRAKGLTLHAFSSALVGHGFPDAEQALRMMQEEETGGGGAATVIVDGAKLTKAGAALVNSEMMFAGGKWDTFRMLTHPGCAIIPSALVSAELDGASGRDYITGLFAGYEVMERM